MKIKVKLYTILKKYAKGKMLENDTIILNKGTTMKGLAHSLNIQDNLGLIFLVNDFPKDKEYSLNEGEEVKIFSK
jgi:molybdopterin converting factor small subunit